MENKTIYFFKEISKIPRESGNEEKISNYIIDFAKKRNLEYIKDKYNNVIIKKYVNNKLPIILQAHLDMVCEKDLNKDFNFKTDSIEVIEEDGYLKANGTTLGADNGIGVAEILNLLDSNLDVSIEAVFTTCEETTMEGAEKIDLSSLKGTRMINLDGFDADTILIESASFTDIDIILDYKFSEKDNHFYKINLTGLDGGHSGFDINKNKGNSVILLSDLLLNISDIRINNFSGGTKINVIPSTSEVIFTTKENIIDLVKNYEKEKRKRYSNLKISIEEINSEKNILNKEDTKKLLKSLSSFKHGVFNINERGEVTTSENLSLVNLENNLIQVGLRSSREKEREKVLEYLKDFCKEFNYELIIRGYQKGFKTEESSKLVNDLIKAYRMVNDKNPTLKSVHIGVEVGFFKDKIKGLDVVIISPKIIGAHSINEKVEIDSIIKCDKWLINYLEMIK